MRLYGDEHSSTALPDAARAHAQHLYSARALQLARAQGALTSPNPMVGCVIVAAGRIIGEGAHRADGQAHAEVEALRRVAASDVALLRGATAYVSLEPCSIAGRTGACTERLVAAGVARVVVSVVDQTPGVCGRGLERLRVGGIDVELGPGQDPGAEITRPRNVYATLNRPFVILKQAVSADGYVGRRGAEVAITGAFAKTLTHQWRSEADAVLVGAGTVLADAPALTVRHTAGRSPAVVVLDLRSGLRATDFASFRSAEVDLQASRKVFWARPTPAVPDDQTETPTADADRSSPVDLKILALDADRAMASLLQQLHALRIGRLLVEGGPATLRRFVAAGCWDEYRELRSDHNLASEAGAPLPAIAIPGDTLARYLLPAGSLRIVRPTFGCAR